MHFYRDVLGFQELSLVPRYRFGEVTLNGYLPHIVAFNTWQGEGAPPPPDNSLGMRYFEVVLPNQAELSRVIERVKQAGGATEPAAGGVLVRDPAHIGIILTTLTQA
jgi:catechol 2,3-dioxygenase